MPSPHPGKASRTTRSSKKPTSSKKLSGQVAADVASLRLVTRPTGATEWVFAERADSAPPLAGMSFLLRQKSLEAAIGGADPERYWYWITDEALADMAQQLRTQHWCLVDGMLGQRGSRALHAEVRAARPRLDPSRLAGGRTGALLSYTHAAVRGDLIGWFDGEEEGLWEALPRYLTKVDTLVAQLKEHLPEVQGIGHRSKARPCSLQP